YDSCPDYLVSSSFPTRRSSDLEGRLGVARVVVVQHVVLGPEEREGGHRHEQDPAGLEQRERVPQRLRGLAEMLQHVEHQDEAVADRKSTRLNSSHQIISYAVFC